MREKPDSNHGDVEEGNERPTAALYNPLMQCEEQERRIWIQEEALMIFHRMVSFLLHLL